MSEMVKDRQPYSYQHADSLEYEALKGYAKRMRQNPTEAEAFLWQQLRGGFMGLPFRRQHVMGDYIVDFVCIPSKLIIEVDGKYHDALEQNVNDTLRTAFLERNGFRVIRFTNEQVLTDIEAVLTEIKHNL